MPYFCAHAANPQIWLPMFEASSDMQWLFSLDSDCCKKSCVSKSCEKPCQDLLLVAALIGAVSMSGFSPQSSSELCYVPVPGYEPQSWNDWLAFLAWLQPSHFAVDISGDLDHQIANPAYLAGHDLFLPLNPVVLCSGTSLPLHWWSHCHHKPCCHPRLLAHFSIWRKGSSSPSLLPAQNKPSMHSCLQKKSS